MKVINCGRVIYVLTAHHIATIVYDYNNGQPSAHIYYDGQNGEIVEAMNGQTLRYAIRLAKWHVKRDEYIDKNHDQWIATLLKHSGLAYH